ncbi:MAG TPA: hydrogenase/urease maturation nickel metallochaperone HypA [Phycisphaerae bacterium]|nr:hydrogenase/urease maturation nickel metallochaperone HypA [Phycisphaerae bacterium]
MHEHGLAKELWPQLQAIAEAKGFRRVIRVEMIVGMLHGVTGEFLAHSFEHAFAGTSFQGAAVSITVVDPGQEYIPPNSDQRVSASGWELLVMRMEGVE